ncbi:MAG: hypothetical protein R3318_05680 [Gammaproteobacteria bacterium]|nr:hypothetical protein [Gammaproteobacteria bacterium]
MIRKTVKFLVFFLLPLLLAMILLLSFSSYWMYSRFNTEVPVAELTFTPFSENIYIAELRTGDFCLPEEFPVYGDQWQLDASFLKWQGPAVLLGFESLYRLERLSGRYSDINEQNTREKLSHNLKPEVWFDFFESRLLNAAEWLVDTQYGSSVYHDIETGKKYIVYKTEDALIVKQKPRQDANRENDILTIEISHACGKEPDFADRLAARINRLALHYLEW